MATNYTLEQHFHYDPYGEQIYNTHGEARNGFSEDERGEENKYFRMGVRLYDSESGRFLSPDPLSDLMPHNTPYHYAFNNPISFHDPTGLIPEKLDKGGVNKVQAIVTYPSYEEFVIPESHRPRISAYAMEYVMTIHSSIYGFGLLHLGGGGGGGGGSGGVYASFASGQINNVQVGTLTGNTVRIGYDVSNMTMGVVIGEFGNILCLPDKVKENTKVFGLFNNEVEELGNIGGIIEASQFIMNILEKNAFIAQQISASDWVWNVSPKEAWDYKENKGTIFGIAWTVQENSKEEGVKIVTVFHFTTDQFDLGNGQGATLVMNAADFGSFNAGFTGTLVGITAEYQFKGAGAEEIFKSVKEFIFRFGKTDYNFSDVPSLFNNTPPYGDRPRDYRMNFYGMQYAQKYKKKK